MSRVAVIGAGPAGLFAAEQLARDHHHVEIYDRMPSAGRKFLLAGRGGLNLTHAENADAFMARYGGASSWMAQALRAFPPDDLRAWCESLGEPVFVGSSGRVFPVSLKAAPLLRAWLRRLDSLGVRFHGGHRWTGWRADGALHFETAQGAWTLQADAVLLALGGASWPRMGSDGTWADALRAEEVEIVPWRPSNCGVDVAWSPTFLSRFEGLPLKRLAVTVSRQRATGEMAVTRSGLEGGAIYALSAPIRSALDGHGEAVLLVDLRPDLAQSALAARLDGDRRGRSLSNVLRHSAGLSPQAVGLVQEALHAGQRPVSLSGLVKAVEVKVTGLQPIARAISSAGGVALGELDSRLMLRRVPGVFAAGEMLDWEAPTGGYLLQGCFSTGLLAARGVADWLGDRGRSANAAR